MMYCCTYLDKVSSTPVHLEYLIFVCMLLSKRNEYRVLSALVDVNP